MVMGDNARGGNDTSDRGATLANLLHGDAREMHGNAHGGDDTLISGTGTDLMWGDAEFINGVPVSPAAPTGSVITGAIPSFSRPVTARTSSMTSARATRQDRRQRLWLR